jgi:hypothetical protein
MRLALCALRAFELGGIMESYLVRIYRKVENNPRVLVGVVEEPGENGKKAFHNLYELWDILNPVKGRQLNRRKTKVNGGGDGRRQKG